MSDLARFEYGLKWWAQMCYGAWGMFSALAGVILGIAVIGDRDFGLLSYWRNCLLAVGFLIMGWFFLAYAIRSRLMFDGARISVRYAGKEKSADLSDIESYHIVVTRNASFWHIDLKDGRYLSVARAFDVDDAFGDFLAQLKEVDNNAPISLGLSG